MAAKHGERGRSERPQPSGVAKPELQSDYEVLIGIPAYNEEIGIGSIILSASKVTDSIVVVDDGSSDRTAEIAREAGATVIRHDSNYGKGSGIRTLFDYAMEEDADILVLMDGDGQHRPSDIPKIVRPVKEDFADIVIGSRYLGDFDGAETPIYRRFGQELLNTLVSFFTETELTDSQSGFRALSKEAIETLDLETNSFNIESEMIMKAIDNNLEIREKPIQPRYEGTGASTWNPIQHGLTVFVFLLREIWKKANPAFKDHSRFLGKIGGKYVDKVASLTKSLK